MYDDPVDDPSNEPDYVVEVFFAHVMFSTAAASESFESEPQVQ